MAVNLINSQDIEVSQTGENIQLSTTVDMQTLESNVSTNTSDIEDLQNGNVYSTDEVDTGKVWKDGKPIYRNWVSFLNPSLSPGASVNVAHGIPNIDTVVGIEKWQARDKNSTSRTAFLPSMTTSGNFTIIYNANETNVVIRTRDTWTAGGYYFEGYIEYTKTTD